MNKLVATRYAEAFFEVAIEYEKLDIFKKDIEMIEAVAKESKELMLVLKHPETTKDEKKDLFRALFKDIDKLSLNFLFVLVDENRARYLLAICETFKEIVYEYQGIELAYVTSASTLSQEEKSNIEEMLKTKRKQDVKCIYEVNKELIAGVRIQIKGEVMDHTILTQLQKLKRNVKRAIS